MNEMCRLAIALFLVAALSGGAHTTDFRTVNSTTQTPVEDVRAHKQGYLIFPALPAGPFREEAASDASGRLLFRKASRPPLWGIYAGLDRQSIAAVA